MFQKRYPITAASFTFARAERLKRTKDIQTLFREGKAFAVFPYRIYYRLTPPLADTPPVQAGFAAPRRMFRRATDRNRIKRLSREAWRLNKGRLTGKVAAASRHLQVFFVFNGREIPSFRTVTEKFSVILAKLEQEFSTPAADAGGADHATNQ